MKSVRTLIAALMVTWMVPTAASGLLVLNYHDVLAEPGHDRYAVSRSMFVAHMDYLQQNGYRPISLPFLKEVVAHGAPLPDRAVLLTFDDGLKSYREFVVPLLEIYGFPSVLSVVTGWLDGVNEPEEYRGKLMTWDDLRALSQSRLVSIITHSHNLHRGIPSNPQGNVRGAATTRRYIPEQGVYESEEQFRARIRNDLEISLARLKSEVGIVPTAIAWPYGEYDEIVIDIARQLKLSTHFVLADGYARAIPQGVVGRMLVVDRPQGADFARILAGPVTPPLRFADLRLDAFVGRTPEQQEHMLSELLDQLHGQKVNAVIVTPVTADGRQALFATAALATATNILDRVLHQIAVRLNVRTIVLRIPERVYAKDAALFFADLARTTRFNAVLFDAALPKVWQVAARSVVPPYRVHTRFGIVGDASRSSDHDFTVVSVPPQADAAKPIDMSRVWVLAEAPADGAARTSLEEKFAADGVLHYGFRFESHSLYRESRQAGDGAARTGG